MESVSNPNKFAKITPGELIPPSPNTPSKAVPFKVTKSSPNKPPKKRKFSEKVKWKITNKMTKKIGIPHILWVKTLSILSDFVTTKVLSCFFVSFTFLIRTPLTNVERN